MKKYILNIVALFCVCNANSQILYNEIFNYYKVGNVGTDYNGVIPGKGGWLTQSLGLGQHSNDSFKITSEANMGNVLTLSGRKTASTNNLSLVAKKTGIESLINQRNQGNNVIKFELDYYTGSDQQAFNGAGQHIIIGDSANGNMLGNNDMLIHYVFHTHFNQLFVTGKDLSNVKLDNNATTNAVIPFDTWMKLIVYLDYNNKKVYFETPYYNTIAVADFLKNSTSTNLIEDFKPTVLAFYVTASETNRDYYNKYDNIKITALKSVPAYVLSTENFLADKFNVFPNPVTDIVNISNTDNLYVENITVYDVAGKQLNTQSFNNHAQIQFNVEHLASGTYMLHIQTNAGIAVKKMVKK